MAVHSVESRFVRSVSGWCGIDAASFLPLGLRFECIMVDVLHAIDLGVAANIDGNVMWETNHKVWCAAMQEANVALLEADMLGFYEEHKLESRLQGTLTVERTRGDKKAPKLKAKSAAIRHLAQYLMPFCNRVFANGSTHDRTITAHVHLLCQF
jgi:hypothetical protein